MAKISTVAVSDTFSVWLSAANIGYARLNQFATNESSLYANTVTANVALVMGGTASFRGQDIDTRFANGTNLAALDARELSALANTNTRIATNLALERAALANTNAYINSMSTDVQLANTNAGIALLNTNLLATNTAIRLVDSQRLANTNSYIATNAATELSHLANTNTRVAATESSIATNLATERSALANTNLYIASMSTDVQLANTNAGIALLNTNLTTTNTAIRLLNTNTQSALDTQEALEATHLANTNTYIAATAVTAGAALPKAGGTLTGSAIWTDGNAARFGTGSDFSIWFDGTHAHIDNDTGGALYLASNTINVMSTDRSEYHATMIHNAAVTLFHNNVAKFQTTAAGIQVHGNANTSVYSLAAATGAVTLDFATYANFHLVLTGTLTLANPTTEISGSSGLIFLKQDGTGSRTLSLGTDYESPAAAGFTLTTTAGATDIIPYYVVQPGRILLGQIQRGFG
jgi:hypothetical protein